MFACEQEGQHKIDQTIPLLNNNSRIMFVCEQEGLGTRLVYVKLQLDEKLSEIRRCG